MIMPNAQACMMVLTATPGSQIGNPVVNPLPVRPNQPRLIKIIQLSNIDSAKRPQTNFGHEFGFWSDISAATAVENR